MRTTTTIDVGTLTRYKRTTGVVFALCVSRIGDDKLGVLLYRYRQRSGSGIRTWSRRARLVDRSDLEPLKADTIHDPSLQHDHLLEALDRQAASSGLRDSRVAVLVEPTEERP